MVVMVFDIGNLHVKGMEWKVVKGRSRGLLLKDGIGMGGKRGRRGREEREKKGRGAACPNKQKSFPRPWPVSINFAARLKCYRRHMAHNGIRHIAEVVNPQIPKPRAKLSVPRSGSHGQRRPPRLGGQCQPHPPRLLLSRPM